MLFSTLAALLPVLPLLTAAQDISLAQVKRAFDNASIPADADIVFNPTILLEVTFPQMTGLPITIHAGEQLPRNATAGPPIFSIAPASSHSDTLPKTFVVATVDLDAPTPQDPTSAQIRHFLGGNFVDTADSGLLRNRTPALSNFLQPTPPAGSPPHRYVFLLFEQSPGFNTQTFVTSNTSITNFNISLFAGEVGLGSPLGGTFMLVGPDPNTTTTTA